MSIGTEIEIPYGIRSIALIEMSIETVCALGWSSREYLYFSHNKKDVLVGLVSSIEETGSSDYSINSWGGHSGCGFTPVPLENPDQMYQSHLWY